MEPLRASGRDGGGIPGASRSGAHGAGAGAPQCPAREAPRWHQVGSTNVRSHADGKLPDAGLRSRRVLMWSGRPRAPPVPGPSAPDTHREGTCAGAHTRRCSSARAKSVPGKSARVYAARVREQSRGRARTRHVSTHAKSTRGGVRGPGRGLGAGDPSGPSAPTRAGSMLLP